MEKVTFTVLGEPVGKGRPRFRNAGSFVQTYTPKKTASYEQCVRMEYERQCGAVKFDREVPLDVRILAYFGIPKSKPKKTQRLMRLFQIRPTKKPDCDNIAKAVLDACNDVAYVDDVQVVDLQVRKFFSDNPRLVVTIKEAVMPMTEDTLLNEKGA